MRSDCLALLVCPSCRAAVREAGRETLRCEVCGAEYDIVDEIPVLLPAYGKDLQHRYLKNYELLARDDLDVPIVPRRFELLHEKLIRFVGDTRGKRVLDIGSAYGSYLRRLDGAQRVALDIALPYLKDIPAETGIFRVCGDAEAPPVDLRAFDVIIISDVLEHLLEPQNLVAQLLQALTPSTRVILHVPWREGLDKYNDVPYEFTHLHSFDEYRFRQLFAGFDFVRAKGSLPLLTEPILFQLRNRLPRRVYNMLVRWYFFTDLAEAEYRYRARWIAELPRREWWLLRCFAPQVMLFELRRQSAAPPHWVKRLATRLLARAPRATPVDSTEATPEAEAARITR